ncbi:MULTISPECIES: hypothetical protein [Brevibacillus]|uniref:hypothetical protein n=1 Tax=Brevibacillus TaxID=55080 RepID=UPI0020403AB5|nr:MULTISPECIES: hypothetical protein [Brevibacillus]MCM3079237.1 hypothetical protein [Brevibacillus invocatus]MCM3429220.1 hypothetical protein [Brevibacillus invocatus]MDH4615601.1 hypothetical protein [Brevibacillus sp. AY1]
MERSFYYPVSWSEAHRYKLLLDEEGVPYEILTPLDLPVLEEGMLAIVFPSIPLRLYASVRTLFYRDGLRYPDPMSRDIWIR